MDLTERLDLGLYETVLSRLRLGFVVWKSGRWFRCRLAKWLVFLTAGFALGDVIGMFDEFQLNLKLDFVPKVFCVCVLVGRILFFSRLNFQLCVILQETPTLWSANLSIVVLK